MSKATGCALSEYAWFPKDHEDPEPETCSVSLLPISDEAKRKVMRQLGGISSKLLGLRLDRIGSLFEDCHGNFGIGECLLPSLLWQWRGSLEGINRGPFDHESEYLGSLISAFISHAQDLPITPQMFFASIPDISEYPIWTSFRAAASRWNDCVPIGGKID